MPGPLARWILFSVVRSARAYEAESIEAYRALRAIQSASRGCCEELADSFRRLLEEEEEHRRVLAEVAAGRMSMEELESLLARYVDPRLDNIVPLEADKRGAWAPAITAALAGEEKTWIFYTNLRRTSKIPVVKRAFEVLAGREREHVQILRRILGIPGGALP